MKCEHKWKKMDGMDEHEYIDIGWCRVCGALRVKSYDTTQYKIGEFIYYYPNKQERINYANSTTNTM